MSLTDEELKWLKNQLVVDRYLFGPHSEEIVALIARLEAAEGIASHVSDWHTNKNCNGTCTAQISLDAWRKAAGKA